MEKSKRSITERILDGVIVAVAILVIFSVIFAVDSFSESGNYTYGPDSFYYRLEEENYSGMVEMYYQNQSNGAEDKEYQEYYAVAQYFEAASLYRAYQEAGDTERAAAWKEKMEEALSNMGELAFLAERIDEKIGN